MIPRKDNATDFGVTYS